MNFNCMICAFSPNAPPLERITDCRNWSGSLALFAFFQLTSQARAAPGNFLCAYGFFMIKL